MNKSLVLYGSKNKLTLAHKRVSNSKQPAYYVRVETVVGNVYDALREAQPMDDETVIISIPLD
jgi:hypothetical protein